MSTAGISASHAIWAANKLWLRVEFMMSSKASRRTSNQLWWFQMWRYQHSFCFRGYLFLEKDYTQVAFLTCRLCYSISLNSKTTLLLSPLIFAEQNTSTHLFWIAAVKLHEAEMTEEGGIMRATCLPVFRFISQTCDWTKSNFKVFVDIIPTNKNKYTHTVAFMVRFIPLTYGCLHFGCHY